MMTSDKYQSYREPSRLVDRLWPQVESLLLRYEVPRDDVETLINELMVALLYKWDGISNHEYWLLKTLERRCQRLYGNSSG